MTRPAPTVYSPLQTKNNGASATLRQGKIGTKISVGTAYNCDGAIEGIEKTSGTELKISELTGTKYAEVASGDVIAFISNDGDSKIDGIVNPAPSAAAPPWTR